MYAVGYISPEAGGRPLAVLLRTLRKCIAHLSLSATHSGVICSQHLVEIMFRNRYS